MPVVVVNEVELGVVVFRREAERIERNDVERGGRIAVRAGRGAEGRVIVVRTDPVRIHPVEYVRNVFIAVEGVEQVQTVRRVAEHQRTRSDRLRRGPGDEPQRRMRRTL